MSEELIGRFTDKTGREWIIDLDVGTCREVLKLTGIDLANFHDGKSLQALWSNDEKLVDVLWVLVKDQAGKLDVDEVAFAKRLNGDVLASGLEAIQQAILGFTRPDRRELVRQIMDKTAKLTDKMVAAAAANVQSDKIDKEADKVIARMTSQMDAAIAKQFASGS